MFRCIFDVNGKNVFDMRVGCSNINIGMQDENFEASSTAIVFDGTSLKTYNGVTSCVANRKVSAVLN